MHRAITLLLIEHEVHPQQQQQQVAPVVKQRLISLQEALHMMVGGWHATASRNYRFYRRGYCLFTVEYRSYDRTRRRVTIPPPLVICE
jgi:hypothetical protein